MKLSVPYLIPHLLPDPASPELPDNSHPTNKEGSDFSFPSLNTNIFRQELASVISPNSYMQDTVKLSEPLLQKPKGLLGSRRQWTHAQKKSRSTAIKCMTVSLAHTVLMVLFSFWSSE